MEGSALHCPGPLVVHRMSQSRASKVPPADTSNKSKPATTAKTSHYSRQVRRLAARYDAKLPANVRA
jgi:hypothetical protein